MLHFAKTTFRLDRHLRFAVAAVLTLGLGALFQPVSAQVPTFERGWQLNAEASTLRFQSVKNETKVESSRFATLSGSIDEEGQATVRVLLDSVDTLVDLRNVRMRFLFFETFQYPEAIITAKIDGAQLEGLAESRRKSMTLRYDLDLHGIKKSFDSEVFVTLLTDDKVAISTASPITVAAGDFALTEGIGKLQEAAGVRIIPSATVSFDFVFDRNAEGATPVAVAEPAKPGAAALETAGNFDSEACLGRFEILSRSGNIFFRSGSSKLDDKSFAILESIMDIVNRCPGMVIEVGGHTDDIGSDDANQALSEARAQSVARYLSDKGIAAERFRTKGYGEAKPVVPNDTAEGRGRNRRIEFSVLTNG